MFKKTKPKKKKPQWDMFSPRQNKEQINSFWERTAIPLNEEKFCPYLKAYSFPQANKLTF